MEYYVTNKNGNEKVNVYFGNTYLVAMSKKKIIKLYTAIKLCSNVYCLIPVARDDIK